ncbi:hypothetical protein ACHHV8_04730 [Paenibacillus sp. TAB 01]|uniref:hypothetical protein n=1 Tax=Paenibacillus sp. TAB 01 TaxID=3368988 RepID=UPI003750BE3F
MLAKQVGTYEQAVQYIREQTKYKESKTPARNSRGTSAAGTRGSGTRGKQQKPVLPIVEDKPAANARSAEEREAMRRRAQLLDGKV